MIRENTEMSFRVVTKKIGMKGEMTAPNNAMFSLFVDCITNLYIMKTIEEMKMLGRIFATRCNGRKTLKNAKTYMNNGLNNNVLPA